MESGCIFSQPSLAAAIFLGPLMICRTFGKKYETQVCRVSEKVVSTLCSCAQYSALPVMEMVLMNKIFALFLGMTVLPFYQGAQGAIPEHLVKDLPGQPTVNFSQYAGYIHVGEEEAKHLFYWFVEADHKNPSTLPIAFWFNGGERLSIKS